MVAGLGDDDLAVWLRYLIDSRRTASSREARLGEKVEGFDAQVLVAAICRGRCGTAAMAR